MLTTEENKASFSAEQILVCGSRSNLNTVAHSLYDVLRSFNESDVDIIFSETFPQEGVGMAIMNRLQKAAGYQLLKEE